MTPTDTARALDIEVRIETHSAGKVIVASGDPRRLEAFDGDPVRRVDRAEIRGPLSARNAAAARAAQPNLTPKPIGLHTSAGTGDRLGLATPGHVQAFQTRAPGVKAVFAQQSIREMERLGRTPQEVLDDATFGCIEAGWTGPVAADADHLKTVDDIDRCLEAGYSLYTIDVGDFVTPHAGIPGDKDLESLPWADLEDDLASARRRYRDLGIDAGNRQISVGDADLAHAMAKYGRAVATGAAMHRHLAARARSDFEVEIAVDETDEPTTPAEHIYIATELARLGAAWVSFAPRHLGTFEKGVEFAGDETAFYASIDDHAAIARALGPYKIGMHSGSDKFSIYAGLMEHTGGMVHLKTSGTSYLTALGVVARHDPELFRAAYAASYAAYHDARASYQVSANEAEVPSPQAVSGDELPVLLHRRATRQILHVGYGAVLRSADGRSPSDLDAPIRALLAEHAGDYWDALAEHIGRHLAPFSRQEKQV